MIDLRLNENVMENEGKYYIIRDSGYTPSSILLTPILDAEKGTPEREFSNALRRARVVIEQTFGIMKEIFRSIYSDRSLHYEPRFAAEIIQACAVLYNFLRHYGYLYLK